MFANNNESNLLETDVDIHETPYDSDINTIERSVFEVSGTGDIIITNTGGSSASEGGMGTGGGAEKGAGIGNEDKAEESKEEADGTWDPLKPKEEKGKEKS